MRMKKMLQVMETILLCMVISVNVSAAELEVGTINDEEDRNQIMGLEENILSDLYESSLSERQDVDSRQTISVDFEKAQKVYVFTPEDFLKFAAEDNFKEIYAIEGQLVWKVPVDISSDYCDYAIIGQGEDGTYNYTTVSAPAESIDSVGYLFYPEEVNSSLIANGDDVKKVDVLSVPMYGIDLLLIETDDTLAFIPYSTQNDRLENGKVYSKEEVMLQIEEMIQENKTSADAGGGVGMDMSHEKQISSGGRRVILLSIATFLAGYFCFTRWRAYKRENN